MRRELVKPKEKKKKGVVVVVVKYKRKVLISILKVTKKRSF
jgi:hypothetical protein